MRHLFAPLALAAAAVAVTSGQAPAPAAEPPTPLWSLSGEFQSPESAFYDEATNSIFVSNINGGISDKDGNGYISRVSADGKLVNARWATGLNGPKGIRGLGGTLWVSDIDEVVGIDIASGTITSRVAIEGAQFLNDLATAPDGTVYVADSFGSRIYAVKDGKVSVFVEGAETVEQVNGLLVDGKRLIAGTIGAAAGGRGRGGRAGAPRAGGPARGGDQAGARAQGTPPGGRAGAAPEGRAGAPPAGRAGGGQGAARGGRGPGAGGGGNLFAFDLSTKARTRLTEEPVGGVDGIEPDGSGGVILTDVFGRRILQVRPSGELRVLAQLSGGGADIGFDVKRRIVIVPYLNEHKVEAYDLTAALK